MVQKIGAQYIGKKLYDTLMAPPPEPAPVQVEDDAGTPVQPDASSMPDLTGETITDEQGQAIGRAQRVHDISVYVITEPGDEPDEELARCLNEPGMRLFFQMDGDRIAGLIYAPDPERVRTQKPRARAVRADEV